MEEQGIFRSALGGFHKGDVLTYIDEITARWDAERQQLQQQLSETQQQLTAAREQSSEQTAQAEAAQETVRQQKEKLDALRSRLEEQSRALEELPALRQSLAALETQVQDATAAAEAAATRCQTLEQETARAREQQQSATAEMMAAEERLSARTAQLTACEKKLADADARIARYEAVLGQVDGMEAHLDGLVRPYLEEAATAADRTLSDTRAALEDMRLRLDQLADELTHRQNMLCNAKADTDTRLQAALTAWLHTAAGENVSAEGDAAPGTGESSPDGHFFR